MALPLEQDSETGVFQAVQQGDRYAFEELVGRHSRWVRGIVFAQLGDETATEDVVQQIWLRLWQQAGTVRDPRTWRAWLVRIARNAAYDEVRWRRQQREGVARVVAERPPEERTERGPEGEATVEEQKRFVREAIRGLPAIYREPLVLRQLEGWSYQEIGNVLGIPVDTVETRLVRARRLLREALAGRV